MKTNFRPNQQLIEQFGTTNPAHRFAVLYDVPQRVADYMFDTAWALNGVRDAVHTRSIGDWIRGQYGRDAYAIDIQIVASTYVATLIDNERIKRNAAEQH